MNRSKLVIYSDSHVLGGADRYLLSIVPALVKDWEIIYIYRANVGLKTVANELTKFGVQCLPQAKPGFSLKNIDQAKKLFSKIKPDLIAFNQGSFYTAKAARLAAQLSGLPFVIIQHGSTYEGKKFYSLANRIFARLTFPASRGMIVPSKSSADFLQKSFKYLKKVKIINHGIDLTQFNPQKYNGQKIRKQLGIPFQAPVLIYIGRLEDDKNAQFLLKVFDEINDAGLHFMIIGEGSLEQEMRQKAKGFGNRIHFLGSVANTAEYLSSADILIQTSRSESFSLAVVEAMAMKVVPVAFKIDSLPNIIKEENLTINYGDWVGLTQLIQNLIHDKEKRQKYANFCHERAKKLFDIHRMQAETANYFKSLDKD